MAKKEVKNSKEKCDCNCHCSWKHHSSHGGIYGLGFIGAAIYYISNSTGFWMGVLGILKAAVWPAFVVYNLLKVFGI